MLETLKFVRGAVSTKDLMPVLKCFHIYNGRIQGSNGRMSIDAPCPELAGFNMTVPAERFLDAVDACGGDPKFSVSEGGRLTISRGRFKAVIPLVVDKDYPLQVPDTTESTLPGDIIPAFRALRPFVGDDVSRPWACGVLIKEGAMYATNNVVLAKYSLHAGDSQSAPVCVPFFAIDEIVRIAETPTSVRAAENSVTLYYGERWVKTQLYPSDWPDLSKFFAADVDESFSIQPDFRGGVEKVAKFADKKVPVIMFDDNGMATGSKDEQTATIGEFQQVKAAFRVEPLLNMLKVATHFDITKYPAHCPFKGKDIKGVIIGIRV